jgi:uncharacterized protein with gpF-like domain
MINVYKKYSHRWENTVKQYALDVWRGRDNEKTRERFSDQADLFSRSFRAALEKRYQAKGINVYRGTIDGKVNDWLEKQRAVQETIRTMAADRQNSLVEKEIERIQRSKGADIQKSINKLYALKKDENVYKVFSFADNFESAAGRIGDDEAFELGRDINEAVLQQNTDRYFWRVQNDSKVRKTHQKLKDLCFLFSDPPTTIDKYGNRHTGNAGTDHGCRCWADPAPRSQTPKRNYVVKE